MACLTIKFISSAQTGSTQGEVYQPFHSACAVKKLLPAFHEKVDLCSNAIENSAHMLPESKGLLGCDGFQQTTGSVLLKYDSSYQVNCVL